jgi:hypothetical protein
MKLEYLDDISDGGKYKDVVSENLIRLFEFNEVEAEKFQFLIKDKILKNKESINLNEVEFIEGVNCSLKLVLSNLNNGIISIGNNNFQCNMNEDSYLAMIEIIEPFKTDLNGYNWLDDQISQKADIDFLFSPNGGW